MPIHHKGSKTKLANGLTPKQNNLKNELLRQIKDDGEINYTKAGLKVFNTTNRKSAHQIVKDTLESTGLQETIDKALNAANATPDHLIENIANLAHAQPKEHKDSTILKANLSLLRLAGVDVTGQKRAHKTTKTTIQQLDFDESKQQLRTVIQESTEFLDEIDSS